MPTTNTTKRKPAKKTQAQVIAELSKQVAELQSGKTKDKEMAEGKLGNVYKGSDPRTRTLTLHVDRLKELEVSEHGYIKIELANTKGNRWEARVPKAVAPQAPASVQQDAIKALQAAVALLAS